MGPTTMYLLLLAGRANGILCRVSAFPNEKEGAALSISQVNSPTLQRNRYGNSQWPF